MNEKSKQKPESQFSKKIKESANQIWLAGLGAYSKAEKEGNKLFEALVKDGEQIENKTKDKMDEQVSSYKDKVEEVKDKAATSWERIEKAFDERVSKALARLNIPTKQDVDELSERIDQLNKVIEELAAGEKGKSSDK